MHIGVYGSGYLGNVVAGCLADFGVPVTCFDEDYERLTAVARGSLPFFERNLPEVLRRNVRAGRLVYSSDLERTAAKCTVIYLAEDSCKGIEELALRLAGMVGPDSMLVIITQVPVGTASRIEQRIKNSELKTTVVSQPVFLTGGCAVEDFNWPDRILLGTSSNSAVLTLKQIYRPLVMRGVPVIMTTHETAELVREASTAFLATKISFINELSALCERVGADAVDMAMALGLDKRIAPRCLQPGAAFGGPFANIDMDALRTLAKEHGVDLRILEAARGVNDSLTDRIVEKLTSAMDSVSGKQVGLLGLAFKPNTSYVTGSSALEVARRLVKDGAQVRAYDPAAIEDAKQHLDNKVQFCTSAYGAADGGDALVVGTGWAEFRALDFERIKRMLKRPLIVDTKNLLDAARLRSLGFQYVGMGRA